MTTREEGGSSKVQPVVAGWLSTNIARAVANQVGMKKIEEERRRRGDGSAASGKVADGGG